MYLVLVLLVSRYICTYMYVCIYIKVLGALPFSFFVCVQIPNSRPTLRNLTRRSLSVMAPKILVGTGTWGHNYGIDEVRDQIAQLSKLGCREIDTAALYPFTHPFLAETFLGEIGHEGILVDTKAMWFDGGNNTLTVDAVRKSIDESLGRLKAKQVRCYACYTSRF